MIITCSVQLYVPPEYMMNKDFLKEVFAEDKALLKLNQVSRINVPLYDELSVANIWPMMKSDEKFMMYFPPKMAKKSWSGPRIHVQHSEHVSAKLLAGSYQACERSA